MAYEKINKMIQKYLPILLVVGVVIGLFQSGIIDLGLGGEGKVEIMNSEMSMENDINVKLFIRGQIKNVGGGSLKEVTLRATVHEEGGENILTLTTAPIPFGNKLEPGQLENFQLYADLYDENISPSKVDDYSIKVVKSR